MASIAPVSTPKHVECHFPQFVPTRQFSTGSRRVAAISNLSTAQCNLSSSSWDNCLLRSLQLSRSSPASSMVSRCSKESLADPEESGKWVKWDFNSGHRQFHAIATKLGDRLLDMMEKIKGYLEDSKVKDEEKKSEWDWEKWQEYFNLVENDEKLISNLKLRLEDAVEIEDYEEAARLKLLISERMAYDTAGDFMNQLTKAIEEERYRDAAYFCKDTGAGLVGWWAGLAEGANDPYGRIVHIGSQHGRFVAKSYNARQLAAGAPGIPLFEIFVTKESDQKYKEQVVYLQRNRQPADASFSVSPKATEDSDTDTEKNDDADVGDEGLRRVLKFLKAGMPGLKFKVLKVVTPEQANTDIISGVFEQLIQDVNKEKDGETTGEDKTGGDLHNDKVTVGGNSDFMQLIEIAAAKVAIGTLLQSIAEDAPPSLPVRVPAKIERRGRDSFCFHIKDDGSRQSVRGKQMTPAWKVATVAKQTLTDPMSAGVSKVPWFMKRVSGKALDDFGEIITLAVSEAQKRRGLAKSTVFHRINIEAASSDPLNGLYTGTFGPYTSEVIQLRRRFGQWHDDNEACPSKDLKLEFFEYVEAVTLTGDLIVPAGQVTFRAKIGKENQLPHQDIFPEHLGVVAWYKGQERRAHTGFWTDAELLLINRKGIGGPHLAFMLSAPDRPILVLFNRLRLPQ